MSRSSVVFPTVGEANADRAAVLLDGNAAGAKGDVAIAKGGAQRVVEVRAVQVIEGHAPPGHGLFGERHPTEERAGLPITRVQGVGNNTDGPERLSEPQPVQDLDGVGTDRDTGAHLAQDAGS